jgi:hypothetical protein
MRPEALNPASQPTQGQSQSPFTQRKRRVDLELVETRTFSSRVVYFRYRVAR